MIEVPSSAETDTLADWAEASCLFGNRVSISEHELEDALDDAGIPDPDAAVSNIWLEIDLRRRHAVGQAYPVNALLGRLERTQEWNQNPAYAFQLLLACQSHYESTRIARSHWGATAKLFEKLSTLALQQYLGMAINIGVPREAGVPARFGDCLDYLCQNLMEVRGAVRLYTSKTKEDGVDVVAWRPFGDRRPGQVVILVQCAAGADWRSKTREIKFGLWREHIDWVTDPLMAFAFPFVCIDDMLWRRLSRETEGLLLDRLRIASMFMAGGDSFSTVQTQLKEWCQGQLARLPWLGR